MARRVPEPAKAIVLVEHDGKYILAALFPDRVEIEEERIETTTIEDIPARRFTETGRRYFRIEGKLVEALAVWGDAETALEDLAVRGTPVRYLLGGGKQIALPEAKEPGIRRMTAEEIEEEEADDICGHCGEWIPNPTSGECPNGCYYEWALAEAALEMLEEEEADMEER